MSSHQDDLLDYCNNQTAQQQQASEAYNQMNAAALNRQSAAFSLPQKPKKGRNVRGFFIGILLGVLFSLAYVQVQYDSCDARPIFKQFHLVCTP